MSQIGQLVVRAGTREINVQYPDARHTLYVEAILTRELGMGNLAINPVINCVAGLPSGRAPVTFGYLPDHEGNLRMT